MTRRLTGYEAIEAARRTGAALNKYGDPIEGPREGISISEAEDVAREDPGLIWTEPRPRQEEGQ